jgi:hypothetical protein
MSESTQLPDLPLMLAGVPAPVANLLRDAGVPVEPLPRLTLAAAGTGRFVLYDSQNGRSAGLARRALREGLSPIDLHPLAGGEDREGIDSIRGASSIENSRRFLERLKEELEQRDGVWARIADFPFPYQSALGLAIEHHPDTSRESGEVIGPLRDRATHFVSSRLRGESLTRLAAIDRLDLGWKILPEDCKATARGTRSHWRTRLARFQSAGMNPGGILPGEGNPRVPAPRSLRSLGFQFACHPRDGICRQVEASPPDDWLRIGISRATPAETAIDEITEHYQAGTPLFLSFSTAQPEDIRNLFRLVSDAERCSLMWQTSLNEFANWWRLRRRLRVQVFRRAAGYEIHSPDDVASRAWGIELWRGEHVATLPLHSPVLHLQDEGLIFHRAHRKSPAGCSAPKASSVESVSSRGEPMQVSWRVGQM